MIIIPLPYLLAPYLPAGDVIFQHSDTEQNVQRISQRSGKENYMNQRSYLLNYMQQYVLYTIIYATLFFLHSLYFQIRLLYIQVYTYRVFYHTSI